MVPPSTCDGIHLVAAIYRPRKDERLSWPSWLTYSGRLPHRWSPVSCRQSAGQAKFTSPRPEFYHSATQPTLCQILRLTMQNRCITYKQVKLTKPNNKNGKEIWKNLHNTNALAGWW